MLLAALEGGGGAADASLSKCIAVRVPRFELWSQQETEQKRGLLSVSVSGRMEQGSSEPCRAGHNGGGGCGGKVRLGGARAQGPSLLPFCRYGPVDLSSFLQRPPFALET